MKKKWLTGIVISLLVLIVLYVAIYWPPFSGDDASGAIGKAERPGRENLEEPEIKLRTDLLKDTTALKKTIQDLVRFYGFTFSLAEYIDTWLVPQLNKYYAATVAQADIKAIEDYSGFLKNNNNTLRNTLEILGGFYGSEKVEVTEDVENKLLGFVGYVNQMVVKDSIFDRVLENVEKYIKQTEQERTSRKKEIENLKNIRDKIVIDRFILALALNQENKLKQYMNTELYNGDILKSTIQAEIYQGGYTSQVNSSGMGINNINKVDISVGNQSWWVGISSQQLGIDFPIIAGFVQGIDGGLQLVGFVDVVEMSVNSQEFEKNKMVYNQEELIKVVLGSKNTEVFGSIYDVFGFYYGYFGGSSNLGGSNFNLDAFTKNAVNSFGLGTLITGVPIYGFVQSSQTNAQPK